MKKILVIGGVTGGQAFAARLRRLDKDCQIIVFEKGKYSNYAHCGLPYYLSDEISAEDSLFHETVDSMNDKFNVEVRIEHEVLAINKEEKKLVVKDLIAGTEYEETYDNLLISTGSKPKIMDVEGADSPLVKSFWSFEEAKELKSEIANKKIKDIAIIGAGYIGLELCDTLAQSGVKVHLIEEGNQVLKDLDFEMAQMLHEELEGKDVDLHLSTKITSFSQEGDSLQIHMDHAPTISTSMSILALGAVPNSKLAEEAGLALGQDGSILIDKRLTTSDPYIFAVGDVVEVKHMITGEKTRAPFAGPTNRQARLAASNVLGAKYKFNGTMNTSIVKVFDFSAAFTGLSEKDLINQGKVLDQDYYKVYLTQNDLADYYPGAVPMVIKLLFSTNGEKIYGAQIVGMNGVDKRIDVIATAMQFNAGVVDIANLELAYTAPFSSGKDPVNMVGSMAQNRVEGIINLSNWDLNDHKEAVLLDIREEAELMAFSIKGAKNIPLSALRERLGELDKDAEIVLFCRMGLRAYNAMRILEQAGFTNTKIYPGGIRFYQSTHYKELNAGEEIEMNQDQLPQEAEQVLEDGEVIKLNCMGLQCPGPLMQVADAIKEIKTGDILDVKASDPGFPKDVTAWAKNTGNTILDSGKADKHYFAKVQKGRSGALANSQGVTVQNTADGQTMVVFSGDFDKVFAAFIIANGAVAMGKKVTMFFTFWGLTALRKPNPPKVKKGFMEKMFGFMLPKGTKKLGLSKMNMAGMGPFMMKKIMKDKNVNSLEDLVQSALDSGVKIMACTMSMDVMGITKEELIDGIEYVGVGTYLGDANESNINLFI